VGRTEVQLRKFCKVNAVETAEQALTLAMGPSGSSLPPGVSNAMLINVGEKFINFDLHGLQHMHTPCFSV
jgi:hypothetical protein